MTYKTVYDKINHLKASTGKPKLLVLQTVIGEGLDKMSGTHKIHGAPAGIAEIDYFINNSSIKEIIQQKNISNTVQFIESQLQDNRFLSLQEILNNDSEFENILNARKTYIEDWDNKFQTYQKDNPKSKAQLDIYFGEDKSLSQELRKQLISFQSQPSATRNTSAAVLKICCESMENIIGGSADLVASTKASVAGSGYIQKR